MYKKSVSLGLAIAATTLATSAHAYKWSSETGDFEGSWITNLTAGIGVRTQDPSCSLVGDPNFTGCGSSANTAQWASGDDGNLNYKKGQLYTAFTSVTSELLLTSKATGLKFMARGTALYDFAADKTKRTDLSSDARRQIVHNATLLDLWLQKDFTVGDNHAYVRGGKQVLNWGESLYAIGGINVTNALDLQKYSIPGTQLKQVLLPSTMITVGGELTPGLSMESYYQFDWRRNRIPPVGSYWSAGDVYGKGARPFFGDLSNFNIAGLDPEAGGTDATSFAFPYLTKSAEDKPQFGVKLSWKPDAIPANFSAYYVKYTDKNPVLTYRAAGFAEWNYRTERNLYGLSTNFPIGDWSIGAELSYRPRDAVALSNCFAVGTPTDANVQAVATADCKAYRDFKKWQLIVNAQLYMRESNSKLIEWTGADLGVLTIEGSWIRYPGVSKNSIYDGDIPGTYQVPAAGYMTWLRNNASGTPILAPQGSQNSAGVSMDFNITYDGTLIPGWQVTPGIFLSGTARGYTPTYFYNYAKGFKSANAYLYFTKNPADWQIGFNYAAFWGGNALTNFYSDRDYFGAFVTRTF